MSMQDLYSALNMFKDGASDLALQRAVGGANDAVQQVKASGMSQMEQRSQLQDISNQLVTHLAGTGTPATTLQALQGAIAGPQLGTANQMYAYGLQRGDQSLMDAAKKQQGFEQDPEYKMQLLQAKAMAGMNGLAGMRLQNEMNEFNLKQLRSYRDDLDQSKASSRTMFGKWADTEGRGDRLNAIMGDPNQWKSMTAQQLALVTDGLVQMTKGGIPTKEESEVLMPTMAKLQAAKAASYATGKPQPVDLSGWAGLYGNMIQREDETAKTKLLDIMVNKINGSQELGLKKGVSDQFKLTTASALGQLGVQVNPNTIQVDPKNGVVIPEIQQTMDAAAKAPKAVNDAFRDMNSQDADKQAQAQGFMRAYGISTSMSRGDAIKAVSRKIKASVFQ